MRYVMNSTFLNDPAVQAQIRRLWVAHANLGFFGKIRRYVKFYKKWCINKAEERHRMETTIRRRLDEAVAGLHQDPSNA